MDFYGNYNQQERESLFKALTTNNYGQINKLTQGMGAALQPESLENTLKVLTYNQGHIKLWNNIAKDKAFATVEEYNKIDSYGEDVSMFQPEGIAGLDTTANYERDFVKIKCMNTTRSVSDMMKLVTSVVSDVEVLETQNGMTHLLGQTEKALFYGDSTLSNGENKEGLEWDGLFKQVDPANTVDLRGEFITDKTLNAASATILNEYGTPTQAYMPIEVSSKFSEQYYPNQRALMNVDGGNVVAGTIVTQFNSIGGVVDIQPDVFMRKGLEVLDVTAPAVGVNAPTPPKVTVAQNDADVKAQFEEGTYKYAVVAHSYQGKSVAVESDAVVVNGAGVTNGVKLTIKNSDVQISEPDYFTIYRTEKDGDKYYEIARIGASAPSPNAETVFVDDNSTLPNTAMALVGDFTENSVKFKQLAPMFKLPYALTGPMHRFGIFLYGSPIVYAPKRFVTIKNIRVK